MPTITTSNRTINSVDLTGSGFDDEFRACPAIAIVIYDAQNNVLAASYSNATQLNLDSWQVSLTGITSAGFTARYAIDAEENPNCFEYTFNIAAFSASSGAIKRIKTIFSILTRGGSYKSVQSPRRQFPTI
jgi:hypothetical protein